MRSKSTKIKTIKSLRISMFHVLQKFNFIEFAQQQKEFQTICLTT